MLVNTLSLPRSYAARPSHTSLALMEQWIGLAEITSADGDGSSGG
jgi:hypothetical protein